MPTFSNPGLDEEFHVETAKLILSDKGLGNEPYFKAPLYLYFLAFFYKISNYSLWWPRFVQIVIGSFLPFLVFFISSKFKKGMFPYIVAIIIALYPTFIYFDSSLLAEPLMVFLCVLLVLWFYRIEDKPFLSSFFIAGLIMGLTALVRPNILLFGPIVFIWIYLVIRKKIGTRKALTSYMVMGLACLIIILPVTVRNYIVADDFVFIAWQGGYNFYIGNNHDADGYSASAPGIFPTWNSAYQEQVVIAENSMGRSLKKSEVSDFWYRLAWKEIKEDFNHFVSLLFTKLRLIINGYEIQNIKNIYSVRDFAPVIKPLLFSKYVSFPYGVVAPLSLLGFALTLTNWRKFLVLYLFLISYTISLLSFFVCARFRQPMIPFMVIFAVLAIYKFVEFINKHRWKDFTLISFIFILLFIESNHNMTIPDINAAAAYDHCQLGEAYKSQGDTVKAIEQYELALRYDTAYAPALNSLGIFLAHKNKNTEAEKYFIRSIKALPSLIWPYLNYSDMLSRTGQHEKALDILELAQENVPYSPLINMQKAKAYYYCNMPKEALQALNEYLKIYPNDQQALKLKQKLDNIDN